MSARVVAGFPVRTGGIVSSSPVFADVDGDGAPEVVVGGPALRVLRLDGRALEGWPRRGGRPFASSPAVGDLDGDGRPEVVCGCDDGRVHAWRGDGTPLPGWPVRTGLDVYSSPRIVDLDGDGRMEVVVGSDDGRVYALRGDGRALPGWPVSTGHFVASSPAVGDLDGDGGVEVVAGSWDGHVHAWRADGRPLRGWPVPLGHFVWSSPVLADLGEGEPRVAVASVALHVLDARGREAPGWPRPLGCFAVARPVVAAGAKGERRVLQAADGVRVFGAGGEERGAFGVGGYAWGAPALADLDGDGEPEMLVGSWDGGIHARGLDGSGLEGFPLRTAGPVFGTPAVARVRGRWLLAVGSWDGAIHAWDLGSRVARRASEAVPAGPTSPRAPATGASVRFGPMRHRQPTFVRVDPEPRGADLAMAVLRYRIEGEAREHPVPLFRSAGEWCSLVQPLGFGHRVRYRLDSDATPAALALTRGERVVGGRLGALARPLHRVLRALRRA